MLRTIKNLWKRSLYRRIFLTIFNVFLFCVVVIPVFLAYVREGSKGGSHYQVYQDGDQSTTNLMDIDMNLLSMDPTNRKSELLVQINPIGDLRNEDGSLSINVDLNFNYKQKKLLQNQTIEPFTMTLPFIIGNVRDYPLENFIAKFPLELLTSTNNSLTRKWRKVNKRYAVPYFVEMDGRSQLFKIRFSTGSANNEDFEFYTADQSTLITSLSLERPSTTIMVCAFVALLMWALAVSLANIAFDSLVYQREIPPPLLSVGVAMLFALPTLRNSQPGVPAMGCYSDILSFFWAIVLIAISSVILLFIWVLRWKPAATSNTSTTNLNGGTGVGTISNINFSQNSPLAKTSHAHDTFEMSANNPFRSSYRNI